MRRPGGCGVKSRLGRDTIEAHPAIVFAALAVSRRIPLPDDLRQPLERVHRDSSAHYSNVAQLGAAAACQYIAIALFII
jgi:hypothetical protein